MTKDKTYPKVGVGVIVFKDVGGVRYVMMHQRKKAHGKGYWGTGGGHLELGEALEAGALRELREEAGTSIVVDNVQFLGIMNFTEMTPEHYVDICFTAQYVSGEPANTEPDKTSDWQWFPLDSLPNPLFPPVKIYLESLGSGRNFFDSLANK